MYIKIGEIVNTHGIKGEVRIISDCKYKSQIFKKETKLYIGKNKECVTISSYRTHKIYDMVTFNEYSDINDVLIYKGEDVYIKKEEIKIDGYFDEELIGFEVYSKSKYIGKVSTILKGVKNDNIVVIKDEVRNLIPNIPQFIEKIDFNEKKIHINEIAGLIHED